MLFNDWVWWLWRAIIQNKLRTFLTSLGIAVGIIAVILLTAIGDSTKRYVISSFSQFGTHLLAINPGKSLTQGMGGILNTVKPLTLADSESLRRIEGVEKVTPIVSGTARIQHGIRARHTDVLGVGPDAADAWQFPLALGQFLPPDTPFQPRPYVVLGYKLNQELFGVDNPLGKWIRIGDTRYRVIGVMRSKGSFLGFDLDDIAYIPARKALQLFNRESLMEIDIVYGSHISGNVIAKRVADHLIKRHQREDFTLTTQDEMLDSLDRIMSVLTLMIAALGAISLLVGGVGILTIMSTAVHERAHEIGLLCALGANPVHILIQFLLESVIISGIGGIMGLAVTFSLLAISTLMFPDFPIRPEMFYVVLALGVSVIIGLLAGVAPAFNAARINPIDTLRAE